MSKFAQRHSGEILLPERLSYSSLSVYAECGEKWRLERGLKLGESFTYTATVAGSAIHEMANYRCRQILGEDVEVPSFEELYAKYEAEAEEAGEEIRPSGTKLVNIGFKGGPNKRDKDWWLLYGPRFFEAFDNWLTEKGWTVFATEHEFEVLIAGEPRIGSIDLVMITPDGEFIIIDLKTGHEPGGRLQLGTYRMAFREDTGIDADWGHYLIFYVDSEEAEVAELDEAGEPVLYQRGARKGEPKTKTVKVESPVKCRLSSDTDFGIYSDRYVQVQYEQLRRGLTNGVFIPNSRNNCPSCPVKDFCRSFDGRKSLTVPIESPVRRRESTGVTNEEEAA